MKIIVQRQPADKQGDDIVDTLLKTEQAGVERGTAAINYSEKDRRNLTCEGVINQVVEPGKVVQLTDRERTHKGFVTMFARTYTVNDNTFNAIDALEIETVED